VRKGKGSIVGRLLFRSPILILLKYIGEPKCTKIAATRSRNSSDFFVTKWGERDNLITEAIQKGEARMAILILFAFVGGIVTILSPCILPILPVILSGGIGGNKSRPLGIVSGFIASFTLFTLTLSFVVRATGISADALRYLAVGLIVLFGLVLVLPPLHKWFEIAASRIADRAAKTKSSGEGAQSPERGMPGFLGGLAVGSGLGLVWTPCVGPIMASVISLALTENIDGGAILITLAYSTGTAIPMLGIMFGGRALLQKIPLLLRNTEKMQKAFGILVILTGIAIGFGWDRRVQASILRVVPAYGAGLTAIEDIEPVKEALAKRDERQESRAPSPGISAGAEAKGLLGDFGQAPEIVTKGRWYNTQGVLRDIAPSEGENMPLSMSMLRGKVVLVDFWTYSCVNCVRTLPHLAAWYQAYGKEGFVIIGVHTPEFEFEKDPDNVKRAIGELGVKWPVVLDNNYRQWRAYSNHYWPAHYFIDADGRIRYRHFGEGDYGKSEMVIQALLKEAGSSVPAEASIPEQTIQSKTPETYLGYGRAQRFASGERMVMDKAARYTAGDILQNGEWDLSGKWTVTKEYIIPEQKGDLRLGFEAKNVFLVVESEDRNGRIKVRLDGKPLPSDTPDVRKGILIPEASRLYQLVALENPGRHVLSLEVTGKLRLFAFTFG
jgi:cytochrome c biogenesis protein CcdA/thiol-disulfide isomerase/thioredoxin